MGLRRLRQPHSGPMEAGSAAVPVALPDATPPDVVPVVTAASIAAVPAPVARVPLGAGNRPSCPKESRFHVQLRSARQPAAEWGCSASGSPLLPIKQSGRSRVELVWDDSFRRSEERR